MNRAEYVEYVAAFKLGTQGLTGISSGALPGCEDCDLPADCSDHARELAGESSFSWCACDFCRRRLGGNRQPAHAWLDGKIAHFSICDDCVYFLEYGKLDDSTMLQMESESEHV